MKKSALFFIAYCFGLLTFFSLGTNWTDLIAQEVDPVLIDRSVVDINGGVLEMGDEVSHIITLTNTSSQAITQFEIEEQWARGTRYIPDSWTTAGGGRVSLQDTSWIYEQTNLLPTETVSIEYRVEVVASSLYLLDNIAGDGILYEIDRTTGQATSLDRFSEQGEVRGLALDINQRDVYGYSTTTQEVFRYDVVDKEVTDMGPLGIEGSQVACLDFDAQGLLWGIDENQNTIFKVNLSNGQGMVVSYLDMEMKGGGCAFGSDGLLYVATNNNAKGKAGLWGVTPESGHAIYLAPISESETVTGLVIRTDGQLLVTGSTTDQLFSLETITGQAIAIGPLGVPHNKGDLAMAGGTEKRLITKFRYEDNAGHVVEDQHQLMLKGMAPQIGMSEALPQPEDELLKLEQDYCLQERIGEDHCVLPVNFVPFMQQYIDDVVGHHFGQVEEVAGARLDAIQFSGSKALSYVSGANEIIRMARAEAHEDANQMVTDWVEEYSGCVGPCPHESRLLNNIRELLTHRQAQAAVLIKRHEAKTEEKMHCALYAQDSVIRHGDSVNIGWDTYGAVRVDIDPLLGRGDLSGTYRVSPTETSLFTLTLKDATGETVECSYEIVVEPACSLSAHRKVIKRGTGTTLEWNAEGHHHADIDKFGDVELKDKQYIQPSETTTYRLSGYMPNEYEPHETCEYTVVVVEPEEYCPENQH